MTDPLSTVGISRSLMELEADLQSKPRHMKELDDKVTDAEKTFKFAKRDAARKLRAEGSKLTVDEKNLEIDALVVEEWWAVEMAKNVAKEADRQFRALQAVLSSQQNRNRVASEADRAHGRYGQG